MASITFNQLGYDRQITIPIVSVVYNGSAFNGVTTPPNSITLSVEESVRVAQSGLKSILECIKPDTLDWKNTPFTEAGKPAYHFQSTNNNFMLLLYRNQEIDWNVEGIITSTSAGDYVTTHASYKGTGYYLGLRGVAQTQGRFFRNPDGASWQGYNNGDGQPKQNQYAQECPSDLWLIGFSRTINNKQCIYIGFADLNYYDASVAIFGSGAAYGSSIPTTTWLSATIMKKAGTMKAIYGSRKMQKRNSNVWGEWEQSGNILGNKYCIPWQTFSLLPDNTTDDPDFPKYPDDDGDSEDDGNPDEPTGGDGDGDKESEDVPPTEVPPTYNATGLLTIYELTEGQLQQLGQELWSENVFTKFIKITGNPIDAVIGLYVSYVDFVQTGRSQSIYLGNVKLGISAPVITKPIQNRGMGFLEVTRFFGDFKDYNPYTKIQLYLPYIGIVDLNVNEVMNSTLTLTYRFNLLSNTCIAMLTVTKKIDETELNSVLYQFDGSFLDELPVSFASNNTRISARLAQLGAVNTAVRQIANPSPFNNNVMKATSGINAGINIMQNEIDAHHLDITRAGNMKGSAGILGIGVPYLIIERPLPSYPSSYAHMQGLPLNRTLPLSSVNGFTRVLDIFIDNFTGTEDEYNELNNLLQTGVVF